MTDDPLIASVSTDVPDGLEEIDKLGRTLNQRANDVLAHFYRPWTSIGPTEAINGRREHLCSALGFQNPTNYIARGPLESGGFRPQLTRVKSQESSSVTSDKPIPASPITTTNRPLTSSTGAIRTAGRALQLQHEVLPVDSHCSIMQPFHLRVRHSTDAPVDRRKGLRC